MKCSNCKEEFKCLYSKYGFCHCPSCGASNIVKEDKVSQHKKSESKKSGNGSKIKKGRKRRTRHAVKK